MNRLFIAIQIIVTLPGQAQTKQNFKNCLSNKKKFRFKCIEDRFSNGKFSSITTLMFFKMIYSRFLHFYPKLVKSFLPQYSIQYLDQELTHTLKAQKKILIHYTNRSFKANSIVHLLQRSFFFFWNRVLTVSLKFTKSFLGKAERNHISD